MLVAYETHFYPFLKIPTKYFMPILIPLSFLGIYLLGTFLDIKLEFRRESARVKEKRMPMHLDNWKKINDKLNEINILLNEESAKNDQK